MINTSLLDRSMTTLLLGSFVVTSVVMLVGVNGRESSLSENDRLPGLTAMRAAPPAQGLVVTSLQSRGIAEGAGIEVGDEILAIDQHPVHSLEQARDAVHRASSTTIQLRLVHNSHPIDIRLPLIPK